MFLALAAIACGGTAAGPTRVRDKPLTPPVVFEFGTTRGERFSSTTTRGRVTAVLFVTTFDLASQLMARRLDDVLHRHRPRANAGAVVLEAPSAAPLAEVFRQSLALGYPVAMYDAPANPEDGPFGAIDRVPLLVVLDRSGRERFRKAGVMTGREIDEALFAADR
jgi:hypothetical protein